MHLPIMLSVFIRFTVHEEMMEMPDDFPDRCVKQDYSPCKCINSESVHERNGSRVKIVDHVCDEELNQLQVEKEIIPAGMVCTQIEDYKFIPKWNDGVWYKVGCELRYIKEEMWSVVLHSVVS